MSTFLDGSRRFSTVLTHCVRSFDRLCHIIKAYLPAEIKWSVIAHLVDMAMWTTCMGTVVYAVFWTLRGYYADIPFVSESVYHQVALSEYA